MGTNEEKSRTKEINKQLFDEKEKIEQ